MSATRHTSGGAFRAPIVAAALIVAGLAVACDDAGTGARRALVERFVGRAATEGAGPTGPERAALLAGRDWDAGLLAVARDEGGLRWTARVSYRAAAPDRAASLAVDGRLDLRGDGAFHARLAHDYETPSGREGATGREAYWLDRLLYTRIANGPFFVRRSLDREHVRWRGAPVLAAGEVFHALSPFLALTPDPADPRHLRIGPAAASPPAVDGGDGGAADPRDRDETWPRWLAGVYRADRVSGDLRLRADGRAVERATLTFEGRTRDGDTPLSLTVRVEASLAPLPAAAARWRPPEGATPPRRDRPHARVERILQPFR